MPHGSSPGQIENPLSNLCSINSIDSLWVLELRTNFPHSVSNQWLVRTAPPDPSDLLLIISTPSRTLRSSSDCRAIHDPDLIPSNMPRPSCFCAFCTTFLELLSALCSPLVPNSALFQISTEDAPLFIACTCGLYFRDYMLVWLHTVWTDSVCAIIQVCLSLCLVKSTDMPVEERCTTVCARIQVQQVCLSLFLETSREMPVEERYTSVCALWKLGKCP